MIRLVSLVEAAGLSSLSRSPHFRIENEGVRDLLVNPWVDLTGRRRPADRVGHVGFDLPHALVAVLQHALVPFRVEHTRAGFERDLLAQRANLALPARLVAKCRSARHARPRARRGAPHAAETVEVMVDAGDAEFDAIQILIGEIDGREHALQQVETGCAIALAAIGEAFAPRKVCEISSSSLQTPASISIPTFAP